jgi:hypothetical protein
MTSSIPQHDSSPRAWGTRQQVRLEVTMGLALLRIAG